MTGTAQRTGLREEEKALIAGLYPGLRRFAAVVAPIEVDPDDLVQDALLRVLQRRPLTDLEHPMAYLRRCLVNLAKDQRRSLGRRRRALAVLVGSQAGYVVADYPSDVADLMRLSPPARAVLYLKAVEGRSFTEIAGALGMSEPAVRSLSSRACRRLRCSLVEEVSDATT